MSIGSLYPAAVSIYNSIQDILCAVAKGCGEVGAQRPITPEESSKYPMPEIRKFVSGRCRSLLALATILLTLTGHAGPAQSQDSLRAAAVVNDDIISLLDLSMRIRLAILGAGVKDTPESRGRIAQQVLRRLIDERLQMQEAERLDISVPDGEVAQAIESLAKQNDMAKEDFLNLLRKRSILPSSLADQIRAQIAWQSVVRQRWSSRVKISPEEVDEIVARISGDENELLRRLAEIALTVETAQQEDRIAANANRLVEQLRGGANFAGLARQFSQSATAKLGGDLGWIRDGQLPEELSAVVATMNPGDISSPIRTVSGYTILLLREEKQGSEEDIDREKITENLRSQRVERLAQRSLNELRRSANVDIRI